MSVSNANQVISDQLILLDCIVNLNQAGPRYMMIEDPTSTERGVWVLEEAIYNLNCVFLYLQVSPSLCMLLEVPWKNKQPRRKKKAEESR